MGRYVGELIRDVREDSSTETAAGTYTLESYSDNQVLRYLNFGLLSLRGELNEEDIDVFRKQVEISGVATQSDYVIPDFVYLGSSIHSVFYSSTGQARDYYPLKEIGEGYIDRNTGASPANYLRRAGVVKLSPAPSNSNGKILVVYDRGLDPLDLRRATIDSVTLGSGNVTALSVGVAGLDTESITRLTTNVGWLSIVGQDGTIKAYNIKVSSFNTGTGDFALTASAYIVGQTPQTGDYICFGRWTGTHPYMLTLDVDTQVERYLIMYATYRMLGVSSKDEENRAKDEMDTVISEIKMAFTKSNKNDSNVQISEPNLLITAPITYLGRR